ncbi:hypothetical protein [Herbaspirillum sp.]|uniref:hypothetical protein n=1 Tax=Herbaspirillum sp. TaxID=1890675 RepID=UPI0031E4655E
MPDGRRLVAGGNCCCAKQVPLYIEKWQEQDELESSSRAGLPVNGKAGVAAGPVQQFGPIPMLRRTGE